MLGVIGGVFDIGISGHEGLFHSPRAENGMEATAFGPRYQGCIGNELGERKRQICFINRANVT